METTENINKTNELMHFLENKLDIFRYYLSITKQLKYAIKDIKEKKLRHLLSERQQCIKKINNIDDQTHKILKEFENGISILPNNIVDLLNCHGAKIKHVVETILPLEKEIAELAYLESNTLRADLLKFQHSRKASREYGRKFERSNRYRTGYPPRFLDTRS